MFGSRLSTDRWPAAIYAVGDVHGCYDELVALERQIMRDGANIEGEKWLVTLGDYIDRGPHSSRVIGHLLEPAPAGFTRIVLRGNHEQMMLEFLADPTDTSWLGEGGDATLRSYGIDPGRQHPAGVRGLAADLRARVPPAHLALIGDMPLLLSVPGWVFVHAGLRPGVQLDRQVGEDLIWIREPFLSHPGDPGTIVVHGHTPTREPVVRPGRIGIDTQCFASGRLTALRVTPDGRTKLFSTRP